MDQPGVDPAELRRALRYIRGVNRLLGYNRATRGRFGEWAETWGRGGPQEEITVLDVGTGSGDVPADLLASFGGRWGGRIRFIGLDLHAVTIAEARTLVPEVEAAGGHWIRGDAMALPLGDASVDYAINSMFVHHLSEEQVVRVLAEMWRVARRGAMVADLLRDRRALMWIKIGTCLASAMVRHDAVVSVRQAFTLDEIVGLCKQAGWQGVEIGRGQHSKAAGGTGGGGGARTHFAHRFTVVGTKAAGA